MDLLSMQAVFYTFSTYPKQCKVSAKHTLPVLPGGNKWSTILARSFNTLYQKPSAQRGEDMRREDCSIVTAEGEGERRGSERRRRTNSV